MSTRRNQYLSGIDIGTTGVKVVIFDLEGKKIAGAYREYGCSFPKVGWVEQDSERLWKEVYTAIREVIDKSSVLPKDIISVSLATQRATLVPVDKHGNPLRSSIVWQDRRSVTQCNNIREIIGDERYYDITGLPIDSTWSISKIMWIRDNQPKLYEKTYKFVLCQETILNKLGVETFLEDWSNGSIQGLMNIETFRWSDELISKLNISSNKLPELVPSARMVGGVSREAAEVTGLAEGTPLVMGGGDQQCAGIGAGIVKPGLAEVTIGTAGVTLVFSDKPLRDPTRRIPCSAHAYPGKWICEGLQLTAGSAYKWYRDTIALMEVKAANEVGIDPYIIINEQISSVPPGSNGVICLPYFAGLGAPDWDPLSRGTFLGLSLKHKRSALARSIIEGITFETQKIFEAMESFGLDIKEIRLTGGATKSPVWNQIQADIYGKPCGMLANKEATSLGAAILGAVGVGVFNSIEEAVEQVVRVVDQIEPNMKIHAQYNELFEIYKDSYKALSSANIFERLSKLK